MAPHETEKLLHGEAHCHLDKAAVYRMGKDIHQLHNNKRLISKIYKEFKKLDISKPSNPILKNGVQI